MSPAGRAIKRLMDVAVSAAALLVGWPVPTRSAPVPARPTPRA